MNFIHHMKDGTIRDNLDGVVVQSKEFYEVMAAILERRAAEKREAARKEQRNET